MPELVEQMYCSQQIVIPPKFPYILKRYCKAAIKTQPYDLLRWSFEYFKALANHVPPPVKLRLEYPIYSTEGGLTRGCLKVLANQLTGMSEVPLSAVKAAWQGFCLDPNELKRIFCLCEVYMRKDSVPFLNFIAVAGGLLTKSLTHTMILLCETLTKEPDGGSAAIPVQDFLTMYRFLAEIDASKDVKYMNGYREGITPVSTESTVEEAQEEQVEEKTVSTVSDDFWEDFDDLQKINLINDHVARTTRISVRMKMPISSNIERSPSLERLKQIERESYMRERKGRAVSSSEVEERLRELSGSKVDEGDAKKEETAKKEEKVTEKKPEGIEILVYDEDETLIPYEIYGEPEVVEEEPVVDILAQSGDTMKASTQVSMKMSMAISSMLEDEKEEAIAEPSLSQKIAMFVDDISRDREERLEDLEQTFDEIAAIVDRFKSANYDLGMIAGRQMSTTSGEFIVQHIEREIMAYIDEQIAVLPDPNLKKKKAKPEEVAMIRELLENFLDENMDVIAPEVEEVEEEEQPLPEIVVVYAVPGIGGPVGEDIIQEFEDYALETCKVQADVFMPRNIRHFLCPPLEKFEEYNYEKKPEEVPMGGIMTD